LYRTDVRYCHAVTNALTLAAILMSDIEKSYRSLIITIKRFIMKLLLNFQRIKNICLKKAYIKNNILLKLFLIFAAISFIISCNVQHSAVTKIDVTGNWAVTISVAQGTINGKGSLSQKGDVVSGWVGPSENDPIPITGMFKNGELIMKTLPQPGRTVAFDTAKLKVNVDSMYGAIDGSDGKGTIKFIRSK
jgi:hypothetical protein